MQQQIRNGRKCFFYFWISSEVPLALGRRGHLGLHHGRRRSLASGRRPGSGWGFGQPPRRLPCSGRRRLCWPPRVPFEGFASKQPKNENSKIKCSGGHTNDPLLQSGRNLRGGAIYVYNATAFLLMASRIKFSSIFNCGPSVFRRFITWTDRSFKGIYNLWRRRPYPQIFRLQLIVSKSSARGFPIRLIAASEVGMKTSSAASDTVSTVTTYWVDDLVSQMRARDRVRKTFRAKSLAFVDRLTQANNN